MELGPEVKNDTINWWFIADKVPAGEWPSSIRKDWVGVALPIRDDILSRQFQTEEPQNIDLDTSATELVHIKFDDAIESLKLFGRTPSSLFWSIWGFGQTGRVYGYDIPIILTFNTSDGRIVNDNEARESFEELGDFTKHSK